MNDLTPLQERIYKVALEMDPGWSLMELSRSAHASYNTVKLTLYRLQTLGLASRREGATARAWRVKETRDD